jgi:uncharacterized protein YndB with AHSA1/START domain
MKIALLTMLAVTAGAEVVDKSASGFFVSNTASVAAKPAAVYAALTEPSKWWEAEHTWSGEAKNLSLVAKAGGCFCERLTTGGEVQHMTVIYADPGKLLRMSGALGPMQSSGVVGTLTFELKPMGEGTQITMSYSAGGYFQGGMAALAAPVDQVLGAQLAGLVKLLGK